MTTAMTLIVAGVVSGAFLSAVMIVCIAGIYMIIEHVETPVDIGDEIAEELEDLGGVVDEGSESLCPDEFVVDKPDTPSWMDKMSRYIHPDVYKSAADPTK